MNPRVIVALVVIAILAIIILTSSIRIVRQATSVVVERVGKFNRVLETGFRMIIPFFERTTQPISLKEQVQISSRKPLSPRIT